MPNKFSDTPNLDAAADRTQRLFTLLRSFGAEPISSESHTVETSPRESKEEREARDIAYSKAIREVSLRARTEAIIESSRRRR